LTPALEVKVEKVEMTQNSNSGAAKLMESCINRCPAPPLAFMTLHFQNLAIFLHLTPASEVKVKKVEMTQNSITGAPNLTESCINRFPAPPLGFMTSHFQNLAIFFNFLPLCQRKKLRKKK
jgi:hypothetical protein